MQTWGVLNTAQRAVVSMATVNRTNRLSTALVLLMILSALTPMMMTQIDSSVNSTMDNQPNWLRDDSHPMETGGRAPCPNVQTDGGTPGDAGDNSSTAKALGSDPSVSNQNGCVDANDADDWYSVTLSANKDFVFELTVPAGADFDLYLVDQTGTSALDYSFYSDPLERVEYTTNSSSAGTYFVYIQAYSGDGNYIMNSWTNNSVPKPDLAVNSISGPVNATAGDIVDVTYTVENYGPGDTNSTNPYDVVFILSTDDTYDWSDTIVESQIAGPYLTAGSNSTETSQVTIPNDIDSDDYHWIVWVDGWGNVTEADDTNNNNASAGVTTIAGMPCPNIDDASTGTDVGGVEAEAYDLGAGFTGVVTGCVASGDKADMYMLSMGRGQNITAVLTADNWDADLDLRIWNTTSGTTATTAIDNSAGFDSNESVSTAGTNADGAADTYYINVSHYSGLANYTLQIWTNGTIFIPAYDCGVASDWGQSGNDAGPDGSDAHDLGYNPMAAGRGCMDPADTKDAYKFSLSGMQGTTINLESDNATNMYIELFETNNGIDEFIADAHMTNGVVTMDTTSIDLVDLDGDYFIVINANETGEQWESGWYNLSFTPIAAPLPDLTVDSMMCAFTDNLDEPTDPQMTGLKAMFRANITNIGGPMMGATFSWEMNLVHEDGTTIMTLLDGDFVDHSLAAFDDVSRVGQLITLGHDISSGMYTCVLTVDGVDNIEESDESNNEWISQPFEIINEDELWADDEDKDGVLNEVDACPNTPGNSTIDRLGCQDNDGDGYSNGNDAFYDEPTQWNDTDGDTFGDNNGPDDYRGDDCPNEAGVATGTNGTGCPIWSPDSDGDGVPDSSDFCQDTPMGSVIDMVGCPDLDGDGVYQPTDTCPDTPPNTQVNATGCAVVDSSDDESGDSSEAEGTTDNDDSSTLLYIIIAAASVLLLVVILGATVMLRSGGDSDPSEQAWATAISPEQQAYEQQLVGMGYTAEQARAYASQYFQN